MSDLAKQFLTIDYLRDGNLRQQEAFHVISELGVMLDLSEYSPILCGTIPLQIDLPYSDLDIIMEVSAFTTFEAKLVTLYSQMKEFRIKSYLLNGDIVTKTNFNYHGFAFELFGQNRPVDQQNAYLHMVIEAKLLDQDPKRRQSIVDLKQQGYNTEAAFCQVLGLLGNDPFQLLLQYGKNNHLI